MQTYLYPSSIELNTIDAALAPVLTLNDPIFGLFPVRPADAALVTWDQQDDYMGLMQLRGYDAEFPSVPGQGVKRYTMEPGVYGEYDVITELEITTRRGFGQIGTPIDISDLVVMRQKKLMTRHYNRMSQVLWALVSAGVYKVALPTGGIGKADAFTPQTFAAQVAWASTTTATPLANFRQVTALHRGQSVGFGTSSTAFMNLITFNSMIANSNANDLGGRRGSGMESIEGLEGYNRLATKDNLPTINVYDEGYKSDGTDGLVLNQWYPFIPDNTVVLVGRRLNNAPIGEFLLTRSANNPNLDSNPFVKVVDSADGNGKPPRTISIYRGFNGGPAFYYPGSVVIMSV